MSKLDHRCILGISMTSSKCGLNCLYLKLLKLINEHNLKIKVNKSKIMKLINNKKNFQIEDKFMSLLILLFPIF